MTISIGLIAEDDSDVAVVAELIKKITHTKWNLMKFAGGGCGKLQNKCRAWSANLQSRGCSLLVLVHDLDMSNQPALLDALRKALKPCPISLHLIVIPVHEIEAWLLADQDAIRRACGLPKRVSKVANPEAILRPKEYLRDVIRKNSNKKMTYVNTLHNLKIAKECSVKSLRRCASFIPLEKFIRQHLP